MSNLKHLMNRLTVALIALAFIGLGFGHQNVRATPTDAMLAAYVAAGGQIDALCLTDTNMPQNAADDCPVCTLAQSMALADAISGSETCLTLTEIDLPVAGHLLTKPHTPRAPPARGPPAFPV